MSPKIYEMRVNMFRKKMPKGGDAVSLNGCEYQLNRLVPRGIKQGICYTRLCV